MGDRLLIIVSEKIKASIVALDNVFSTHQQVQLGINYIAIRTGLTKLLKKTDNS